MAKFLTILIALVAAWFTVMLLGYLAVRLGRVLVRWVLHGLAAMVLVIAAGAGGMARAFRGMTWGTIRWAIRRLEPGAKASAPVRRAGLDLNALPAAIPDERHGWAHAECGHPNRPEAKYCGKCGAPRSEAGRAAPADAAWPAFDAEARRWPHRSLTFAEPVSEDSSGIHWLDGAEPGRSEEIAFLDEARRSSRA